MANAEVYMLWVFIVVSFWYTNQLHKFVMLVIARFSLKWFDIFVTSTAERDINADFHRKVQKELEELREFTRYEKEFRDASILEHHEVGSELSSFPGSHVALFYESMW
jgi:hypothetical protein